MVTVVCFGILFMYIFLAVSHPRIHVDRTMLYEGTRKPAEKEKLYILGAFYFLRQ